MRWVRFAPKSRKRILFKVHDSTGQQELPTILDDVNLETLRSSLLQQPSGSAPIVEAGGDRQNLVAASVLFPIVLHEQGPAVLLTQRTDQLRDHPGQISFPGGRVEPGDLSAVDTALREAYEEIGLSPRHVEVIGFLPEYLTATGYRITPVVAFLTPPFSLRADPSEVAEVFEVPLAFLMNPANHERHSREYQGRTRHFFAMPYGRHYIWGATAGIIVALARLLAV